MEFVGNGKCTHKGCELCYPKKATGRITGDNQYPDVLTGQVPVGPCQHNHHDARDCPYRD